MTIGDSFQTFCSNLAVKNRSDIGERYGEITKRLNLDFWNSTSSTDHSFYSGSYGRGTAIGLTSDMDMIFELPSDLYWQYDRYTGNGQSALLQAVKSSIKKRYFSTDIGGDGQVVVVVFSDGMKFEVVPAFYNKAGNYTYPDSNSGGSWKTTDPKPEISAINEMDKKCNYNLKNLCKMMRAWKLKWNVPIKGLLIDTLAYNFLQTWKYRDKSYIYYDWLSRDFFEYLKNQDIARQYWYAPGSNQRVYRIGEFEHKAARCYNIALEAIKDDGKGYYYVSRDEWRDIYGTIFPK